MFRFTALLLLWPALCWAQVPRLISYQGVLTDPAGGAKPDTSYAFIFSLHSSPDGEASVWSEQKVITTREGHFETMLGDATAFPDSIAFDRPLWLGVQVDGDVLAPRLALNAVPYALGAERAARADTALVAKFAEALLGGSNVILGSGAEPGLLTVNSNDIPATLGTSAINLDPGMLLANNAPAHAGRANNSPSIQLRQFSWNPDARASQENSWYVQNWGFSTAGIAGGVFSLVNRHQQIDGSFRVVAPFAVDEIGRTIIGYSRQQTPNYFGFWGEDFGQWKVVLAGKTVVGWPENSISSDLVVTGRLNVGSGVQAAGDGDFGGTLRAGTVQASQGLVTPYIQTEAGQKVKLLSGTDTVSVDGLLSAAEVESSAKAFGYTFNGIPVVMLTRVVGDADSLDGLSMAVSRKTAMGFSVRVRNLASGSPSNRVVTFQWMAIGY